MKTRAFAGTKSGFTLIELLVVIVIFALLVGALVPSLVSSNRAAKKAKDQTNARTIVKAMINWASANKTNQFPPQLDSAGTMYGGDVVAEFATLLNGPSTGQVSYSSDPLPPEIFISPVGKFTPMVPYGIDPAGNRTVHNDRSFYDGPMHCSYGVLNGGQLNKGNWKGNYEGRFNNGRSQVPLVYNALNYIWLSPPGHPVCDWNRVATGNAADWKGNITWADDHVTFSETPNVPTVMSGKTYTADDLNGVEFLGPDGDAVMGIPTSAGGKLACTYQNWQNY